MTAQISTQDKDSANSSEVPGGGLEVVILAAGQGTRMRSGVPKVLHQLAGKGLLARVLETVDRLQPERVHVVVGHQAEAVREAIGEGVNWVSQAEQLGTGHAVSQVFAQAQPHIDDAATVLVVYADVPLVSETTLRSCVEAAQRGNLGLITAHFAHPAQLGRIIRNDRDEITEIVEFADASEQQRAITEINTGILALDGLRMKTLLGQVEPKNAQTEYYLTDLIGLAVAADIKVEGLLAQSAQEVAGINDRAQLAELERYYQLQQAQRLMREGVTLADPRRIDVRGELETGEDCFIDANVVFEGQVKLGTGVSIGSGVVIRDSIIGDDVCIEPHTLIDGAVVAARCSLGPFARIRPGSRLAEEVRVGNFVETKNAVIGRGTKASHLAYLGDATLGDGCNVGAGTVTCNYDGVEKHQTSIGDRVFVGTNSTLIAPVQIGDDAFVAAGSTITSRIDSGVLAVGRGKQRNIKGWVRPDRREKEKGGTS